MKTTNTVIEAIEPEQSYIATKVRTEVWEERTEMDISSFECNDMAAVIGMFAHSNEISYVVKNLATGEKRTCGGKELREWLATQALDTMVDFHISFTVVWDRASLHGRGKITHEVHFTRAKRSEVDTDKKHTDDGTHMVEDVPQDF